MPVELKLTQIGPECSIPAAPDVVLRQYVLWTLMWVGRETFRCEAVIDTGAAISIMPHSIWRDIEQQIEWLSEPDDAALPAWLRLGMGYTGGSAPCRLGRMPCGFVDDRRRTIGASVSVIAKCLMPEIRFKMKRCIPVGLQHRPLIGRKLIYDASARAGQLLEPGESSF